MGTNSTPAGIARLVVLAAACLAFAPASAAAQSQPGTVPGEVIVAFEPGASAVTRTDARAEVGASVADVLPVRGLQVLAVDGPVDEAIAELEHHRGVRYAVPNVRVELTRTPNDPLFGDLWGFNATGQFTSTVDADIDAPEAWDITTGSSAVTVAVVDTGIADHPDLDANRWTNPGESGGGKETNGVDDDGNGYVDDWRGYDFWDYDNVPSDGNGHGTHVAGTIGAVADNGIGVAGVAWHVRLMALDVFPDSGFGDAGAVVEAFAYAGRNGARIVNASLGHVGTYPPYADVMRAYPRTLFVAGAGNGDGDGVGDDNEIAPFSPCAETPPNVVCVAASDVNDLRDGYSNWGATSVDLAAPGDIIRSTDLAGAYSLKSGTSMAAPHVSGAAALLLAHRPGALAGQIKVALLDSVDLKPAWAGKTVSGGRLNVRAALDRLTATYTAPAAPQNTTVPTVTGTAAVGHTLRATAGTWANEPTALGYQWQRCNTSGANCTNIAATGTSYVLASADQGATVRVRVTASSPDGSGQADSTATTVVVGPPQSTAAPVVSGTARDGHTLAVTAGSWSDSPTTIAYSWQRCDADGSGCSTIVGSGPTFTLTSSHIGYRLRVRVSATNTHGTSIATSNLSGVVQLSPPQNTLAPSISTDDAPWKVGSIVWAGTGAWTGDPTTARRWQRCNPAATSCTDIGSTGVTYALSAADAGYTIRLAVDATNASGTATAASAASPVIAAADPPPPPQNTAAPTIAADTPGWKAGAVVYAWTGSWTGAPTIARRWQRCNTAGSGCTDIGSTASTYTLTAADAGYKLRLAVDATNAGGTVTAVSTASPTIARADTTTPPPSNDSPPSTGPGPVTTTPPTPPPVTGTTSPTGTTTIPTIDPGTVQPPVFPVANATVDAITVGRGTATVKVRCTSNATCKGTVALAYKGKQLGTRKFSIRGGKYSQVAVKLTGAAAKKLPKRGRVALTATVQLDGTAPQTRDVSTRLK
jgi:subtilisin family serine protease